MPMLTTHYEYILPLKSTTFSCHPMATTNFPSH